jgi:hypothetical protein
LIGYVNPKSPACVPAVHEYDGNNEVAVYVPEPDDVPDTNATTVGAPVEAPAGPPATAAASGATATSADTVAPVTPLDDPISDCTWHSCRVGVVNAQPGSDTKRSRAPKSPPNAFANPS